MVWRGACNGGRHTHRQGADHRAQGCARRPGSRQGDLLSSELEDGSVRVRAVAPLDVAYLQAFAEL
jgi:hypothetical protein